MADRMNHTDTTAALWEFAVKRGMIAEDAQWMNVRDWERIKSRCLLYTSGSPQLDAVARLVGLSNGAPVEIIQDIVEETLIYGERS